MSFGCYRPDANTNLGCRPTASSMSLKDTKLFQQRVHRETRNPITGEVVNYSRGANASNAGDPSSTTSSSFASNMTNSANQTKSDIFHLRDTDSENNKQDDFTGGKKQMPEQRYQGNLNPNLTLPGSSSSRGFAENPSRIAEGNLTVGSMVPSSFAITGEPGIYRDTDSSSNAFTHRTKVSYAGGECGQYLKPRDKLGPGCLPIGTNDATLSPTTRSPKSHFTRNNLNNTRYSGKNLVKAATTNIRPTEFGMMYALQKYPRASTKRITNFLKKKNAICHAYSGRRRESDLSCIAAITTSAMLLLCI
ncbi:unnamed protein product [Amoebophrya sp. A120]|nr:unnamed protein product [Amoebophrya sp. A120]|eukprot:GSA120T00013797001.1